MSYKPGLNKLLSLFWPKFTMRLVVLIILTLGVIANTPAEETNITAQPSAAEPAPEQSALAPDRSAALRTTSLKDLYLTPKTFAGKKVVVVGMVQNNPEAEKVFGRNSFILFRRLITCCEDDAQTVGVIVANPTNSQENKTWLRVQGTFSMQNTQRGSTLIIKNAEVEKIAAPKSVYLK